MPVILPDPLIKAARERKLVLFVGSGLSSRAGYPTWPQLIDRLVAEAERAPNARKEGLDAIKARGDYLMLAEFARVTLGAYNYTEILKEEVGHPLAPTAAHRLIAATDYRGIITTNGLHYPDFNLILRELTLSFENYAPTHYALVANPGTFESDHLRRQMNIQLIGYDPADNHREVDDVLRQLRDAAPAPLALAA